ncbi:MAG: PilZ domain-containing protein [Rhizobiaceae bacterium]
MSPITEKSIGVDGAVFPERRADLRRRVLKGATVSFNNGYSSFECVVRNQSENGARLSLAETFALPKQFWLIISDERPVRAEVRWSSMTAVGVEFI